MVLLNKKDNILQQVRGEGLIDGDGDGDGVAGNNDNNNSGRLVYVLHPNCAIEEM